MSSDRKDARWQLGYDMIADTPAHEALGSGLPYPVTEKILLAAQALLDHLNDPALEARLASRFRDQDDDGQVREAPTAQ